MVPAVDCRPAVQGNSWGVTCVTSSQHNLTSTYPRAMLVSLTVGKVDAGVAVLLTEDKRLVRVPMAPSSAALPGASLLFTRTMADPGADRVPLHSPAAGHLLGQHSRHRRSAQCQGRERRRDRILQAPV